MKNCTKVFVIFIIIINALIIPCKAKNDDINVDSTENEEYVNPHTKPSFNNFWSAGSEFINEGETEMISEDSIAQEFKGIVKALTVATVIMLLIGVLVIGIKYMLAEPKQQAELRKKLIGVIIAIVIIGGAFTIWEITYNFMSGVEREITVEE